MSNGKLSSLYKFENYETSCSCAENDIGQNIAYLSILNQNGLFIDHTVRGLSGWINLAHFTFIIQRVGFRGVGGGGNKKWLYILTKQALHGFVFYLDGHSSILRPLSSSSFFSKSRPKLWIMTSNIFWISRILYFLEFYIASSSDRARKRLKRNCFWKFGKTWWHQEKYEFQRID